MAKSAVQQIIDPLDDQIDPQTLSMSDIYPPPQAVSNNHPSATKPIPGICYLCWNGQGNEHCGSCTCCP